MNNNNNTTNNDKNYMETTNNKNFQLICMNIYRKITEYY